MKTFKIAFIVFMVLAFSYGAAVAQEDFRSDTSALAKGHQPLVDQLRQHAGGTVWIKARPKTGVVSYIGVEPSRPIRQPAMLGAQPAAPLGHPADPEQPLAVQRKPDPLCRLRL